MFTLLHVLFLLLGIPATTGAKSVSCPILVKKDVADRCSQRTEHGCFDDSVCSTESRCCPTSRDGGCALMCVKPRALEGCPIPIDFAMIVDTSGSISRSNFKRLLEFIEDMLDGFDISDKGTHIAVIEYSTDASVQLRFDDFSGAHMNAANLKRKIRKIPHARGYTYIDKALKLANTDVFSVSGGTRPNVPKVALVMTDGRQTVDGGEDREVLSSDILGAAVQPLKDKKVKMMSLGIGKATYLFDLMTIASTDDDVYLAENFKELKGLVSDLTQNKCPVPGNWSAWGAFGECSVSCGKGTQTRFRACDNPLPAYGGRDCIGESEDIRLCNDFPCAVDGNWAEWKPWGICPVTCGGGIQTRERTCTNPPPLNGGRSCEGDAIQSLPCNEIPCPVNGRWTEWKAWSRCNVTCGGGTQTRSRTCTNPPPQHGGEDCNGENEEMRSCNDFPCPIDGKWTNWKDWEPCSVTCGGGVEMSRRTCTNPAPAFGGADCEGVSERSRSCNERGCPVDGKWSDWQVWSQCSVTCGGGTQDRSRTCTNPAPKHGGKDCSGESDEIRSCNDLPCPIDGNWTNWKDWEPCSVTCGGGVQISRRTCTNPAPAFGGADCEGVSARSRSCNERGCPVDGKWSDWKAWSQCSVTCGDGTQDRSRTCTNPAPKHGGNVCRGKSKEVRSCSDLPCPIDGTWTAWKAWEPCSVTCGGGIQVSRRTCTNPAPAFGGADCEGVSERSRSCNERGCPVDGKWSDWKAWSQCSVTCGGGTQDRSRTCTNPPPQHGGRDCKGENEEVRSCNDFPCPIDGKWTVWKSWEPCSVTCGGGVQMSGRTCTNPAPAFGGADCEGVSERSRSCNERGCPVDANWSEWGPFSVCSVSCGGGTKNRSRTCTNPPPKFEGADCVGESRDIQSCNNFPCPIDGRWSGWGRWGSCSLTCGGGIQDRLRTCTNPPAAFGGKKCSGPDVETRFCQQLPCPVDGRWSAWDNWGTCSASCGGGIENRSRSCTNPPPAFGGQDCKGDKQQIRFCNEQPCPVNGNWTFWGIWRRCTKTCGGGRQDRLRTCTNPPPAYGGAWCTGPSRDIRSCNEHPCPVDGSWSGWKPWGPCSVTCAGGIQRRTRTCTNPPPIHGGRNCEGNGEQRQSCNNKQCPVDGNWTEWRPWRRCSVTCGGGLQDRFRSCTNPPPAYGGANCIGERREIRECSKIPCPVDGSWARWRPWGTCTVKCGGGTQIRTRDCSFPPPAHGGRDCSGKGREVRRCSTQPCPVDGNWTAWRPWKPCSRTCGGGTQRRSRTCTNPPPAFGGLKCSGMEYETRSCNEDILCPVPGGWAQWSRWDACSVTCGSGVQFRYRTCTNPPPSSGGADCLGQSRQIYYCYRRACPVDGSWSVWERWERCSKTCNGGTKKRYRSCSNPPPSNGGRECPAGGEVEVANCNTVPCAVDGNWGWWDSWSACSVTCGNGGKRTRTRKCDNPPPAYGGRNCQGRSTEAVRCSASTPCGVNCNMPLDFAIIVDTSGSISRRNFQRLLRFIRSILKGFEIGEDLTRVALIEYSTNASVQLNFNDLTGSNLNSYNVDRRVRSIPHRRGATYIDRALRLAHEKVFNYKAGMRNYVKKVALVMTDGEQTVEKNAQRTVREILEAAAQPLKDKGVNIISLGIGRKVNRKSLEAISTGNNVFMATSFNDLRTLVRDLRKGTCLITAAGNRYPRYQR